jgi:hypothetical protein
MEKTGQLKYNATANTVGGLLGKWEGIVDGKVVCLANLKYCYQRVQELTGKKPTSADDVSRKQWNREYFKSIRRR